MAAVAMVLFVSIAAASGNNSFIKKYLDERDMQAISAHAWDRDNFFGATPFEEGAKALPKDVNVCIGEGVRIRVTGLSGDLRKCGVYSPSGKYYNLMPSRNGIQRQSGPEPIYWDSEIEGERCGFLIREVTMMERGKWKVEVETTTTAKTQNATASVYPEDCTKIPDTQYVFNPGQKIAYAVCGDEKSISCLLRKPRSPDEAGSPPPLRDVSCSLKGTYDSRDDGTWTCDWANDKSLKKRSSKMTLTEKPIITTETKVLAQEIAMLCKYTGNSPTFKTCRWVGPGGQELYPHDGLVLGRYAYYGSGVILGECGLSIMKPLEDAEKGVWRCEMYTNTDKQPSYGAYIELGIPKRTRDERLKTLRKWAGVWRAGGEEVALAVVGQPLTIGCSLYAPLSFCQILHPNGSRIEPLADVVTSYGSGNGLGDCGLTIASATIGDSGIWKCIVGVEFGEAVTSVIDVKVYGSEMEAVSLERSGGGGITIRCETVFGGSLDHCRFQRPDGSIFTVSDKKELKSESFGFEAIGNFTEGICSVTLSSIRSVDVGVWRCIGRIAGQSREITATFKLKSTGVTGASVGVITSVVVFVVLLVGVGGALFVRYRRRRGLPVFPQLQRPQQRPPVPSRERRISEEDEAS